MFGDINDYPAQIVKDIFDFFFLRFKRMRGRWFINSMRAEHSGKSKSVDDSSTRGRKFQKKKQLYLLLF